MLTNIRAEATCPTGWSSKTVTLHVGDCDYKLKVCYKCAVSYPGDVYILGIEELDSSCNNILPINQIIEQAYVEISRGAFIYSNLCVGGLHNAPPCDGDPSSVYSTMNIHWNYCWQVWYRHNGIEPIYEIIPCEDNAECIETIKFCWNGTDYTKVGASSFSTPQTPPCSLEYNQITYPTILNQKSGCFILHSVPCGTN